MQQEMYQRRNSAEDSLIMTNNWAHATMPAEWAQGQVEFKWGKKKQPHGMLVILWYMRNTLGTAE